MLNKNNICLKPTKRTKVDNFYKKQNYSWQRLKLAYCILYWVYFTAFLLRR